MQTTHPRRKLHPGVIFTNASMVLGAVLLFFAEFRNWLDAPRLAGGFSLLIGLGCVAEIVLRRIGWLAETEKPKQLGVGWLLFIGLGMSLVGIRTLLGY